MSRNARGSSSSSSSVEQEARVRDTYWIKREVTMSVKIIFLVFVVSVIVSIHSHPCSRVVERQKRMSDQRLAELETLIALTKMKHKLVTVPVGFGRVDPAKLGRRRRSVEKLLRVLARDASSSSSEEEQEQENEEESRDNAYKENLLNLLYDKLGERTIIGLPD